MAQIGRAGSLQLLRVTGKLPSLSAFRTRMIDSGGVLSPPEPETAIQLDSASLIEYAMDSQTARAPSLPRYTLRRHPSEIGAVCANERPYGSVRGQPELSVPTVLIKQTQTKGGYAGGGGPGGATLRTSIT